MFGKREKHHRDPRAEYTHYNMPTYNILTGLSRELIAIKQCVIMQCILLFSELYKFIMNKYYLLCVHVFAQLLKHNTYSLGNIAYYTLFDIFYDAL